jgi:hypothetical protein
MGDRFCYARRMVDMSNFWMGIAAAQNAATTTKLDYGRRRVVSILAGIGLALLITVGLLIMAALND